VLDSDARCSSPCFGGTTYFVPRLIISFHEFHLRLRGFISRFQRNLVAPFGSRSKHEMSVKIPDVFSSLHFLPGPAFAPTYVEGLSNLLCFDVVEESFSTLCYCGVRPGRCFLLASRALKI